jgi:sulfate transport system permease protein
VRHHRHNGRALSEPWLLKWTLCGVAFTFLFFVLVLPVAAIFVEAFRKGVGWYWRTVSSKDTRAAVKITLETVAIVVPANTLFGIAAAWAIAKFRFRGKQALTTLIDLPFAISPVISGMVWVLLFGRQGVMGPWLAAHHVKIIYAMPGIVLATMFVTFPFVARELIHVMQSLGNEQEEAGLVLGANGWRVFTRITLPSVKWGLVHGIILATARAMGEFGAVSVVSRGETNTVTLHVAVLYDEYNFAGAFAVASLLLLLALATLVVKRIVEARVRAG